MPISILKRFFKLEAASGIMLIMTTVCAIYWANSPWAGSYATFTDIALFPINDGLMAVFFLLVGLELKRGYLEGRLSTFAQVGLPAVAAIGGMIAPAAIYLLVNYPSTATMRGWATPVATDIAFAIGVLSLFGSRVPRALILFLLALATFDDLGAILIIAFAYTEQLAYVWLIAALPLLILVYSLKWLRIQSLLVYLVVGCLLWFCILKSGIHPTVAGVLFAFAIPADENRSLSLLHRLEHYLQPWVAYFIMPIFALANAGFSLEGMHVGALLDPVVVGIAVGLFVGKQIGVFGFAASLIKLGYLRLPKGATWLGLYGISILCGIGFTMSLFLGTLSFQNEHLYLIEVRLGVILGSLISSIVGAGVLYFALHHQQDRSEVSAQ